MANLRRDVIFVLLVVGLSWFVTRGQPRSLPAANPAAYPAVQKQGEQAAASAPVPAALANAPLAMKKLAWFVGTWTSEESVGPGNLASSSSVGDRTEEVKVGPDGLSLISNYTVRGPRGTFKGQEIIEYDRETDGYKISGSDKANPSPSQWSLTGDWDSEVLSFQGTMDRSDQKLAMKLIFYDIRANSFTMILYLGEKASYLEPVQTAQYTRVR